MKFKKVLASVLLIVTLFNAGITSYATESVNSSHVATEEKNEIKLTDLLNQLEKENRISEEQNQKLQEKIKDYSEVKCPNPEKKKFIKKYIKAKTLFYGIIGSLFMCSMGKSTICDLLLTFLGGISGSIIGFIISSVQVGQLISYE